MVGAESERAFGGVGDAASGRRGLEALFATLLYAAAVPWVFRPWFLAADLLPHSSGPLGAMVDADLNLNIWILAWAAHAALTDFTQIFQGNIFHPAPNALVGSENMLAHLPFTAPALALTGDALFVLKTYVLESFALSGLGMFLYVRHHTRSLPAAFFAGAAYTFTAFRAETIPQPQYLAVAFLPLAFLALDLWLQCHRLRWLVALAACLALQAYSCVYVGFFTLLVVPVYALARLAGHRGSRLRAALGLLVAGLAAGVLLIPLAIPYLEARSYGMVPDQPGAVVRAGSWTLAAYFSSAFIYRVGLIPLALVVYGLVLRLAPTSGARRVERQHLPSLALWAVVGASLLLGLGPVVVLPGGVELPTPYAFLQSFLPGFSSLRVPIRFVTIVAAGLSALAGFALAEVLRDWRAPARLVAAMALAVACVLGASSEVRPTMAAGLGASAQPAYLWLAQQEGESAVVEIPGPTRLSGDLGADLRNSRYMVASTLHWRPLVNGYTAYPPPASGAVFPALRDLPDGDALQALVDLTGVGWLVLHRDALAPHEARRWSGALPPGLVLAKAFGAVEVYRVDIAAEQPWAARLAAPPRRSGTTFAGTSVAPLGENCRPIGLTILEAPARFSRLPVGVRIGMQITNASPCALPALGQLPHGLVGLAYRWRAPGAPWSAPTAIARLLRDLAPGTKMPTSISVSPPGGAAGTYELEIQLIQQGEEAPLTRVRKTFAVGRIPAGPLGEK